MKKPLWAPSEDRIRGSNMMGFLEDVNRTYHKHFTAYDELYQWSVDNMAEFWGSMWNYGEIRASKGYETVVDDLSKFPGASWFVGARLNFAENLLRHRDDRLAFVFRGETQKSATMTYRELYDTVARLAAALREMGVMPGDRVAAYMPNMMETAIAMLAATSIGATWASCATDVGPGAVLDRFGQIEPKVLFTVDGYFYKGKTFDSLSNAVEIVRGMPCLENVVVVSYVEDRADIGSVPRAVRYDDLIAGDQRPEIRFEQVPFDHPGFIMFSSGTTGKPKCLVQGAGGVLINQLKELMLHADLKREDIHLYITTCSWMMWNWLVSSLAVGATVVLYDGNPLYPDVGAMWKLIQDEKVTVFGTSASYITYIRSQGLRPGTDYDLSSLRTITQTGSPLSAEGFEYVYEEIKKDVHFGSISGGTDINGCFALSCPITPVYAGELQVRGLGVKTNVYDEKGHPIVDREGELVCEAPFPPMPLYFWNDPDGKKYHDAYFAFYPNVWRHGDYVKINSETGGLTFCGRSDAVLKPSGVRIGTAEIYNQVEKLEEIADSLAIGQTWEGDQRIVLFVKLAKGCDLTEDLRRKIKRTLREKASPRHVPAKIIAVPDIPYTLNMKKVESAVTNLIHGKPVLNRDALINPESLDHYEGLLELGT